MARSIEFEHSRARGFAVVRELLRAMRPKDWIKNVFVFAAIAFARDPVLGIPLWQEPRKLLIVCGAFVLFSMVASSIYLINDLVDIDKDRAHPKKRNRPLASGKLSPALAKVASVLLLVVALPLSFGIDIVDVGPLHTAVAPYDFGIVLLTYLLVQGLLYSYYLKHRVILDIFTIAAGFVMRAVAGALVLDITITSWLLICMGLLALFLGLAKRRAELVLLEGGAGEHRRILEEYSLPMLDQMLSIVTAAFIVSYALFTTTAPTLPRNPFPVMLVTVPFVIYAIFRYLYLMYRHGGGGNPADLLLSDRPFALSIVIWGITAVTILAVRQ
ncbi:MAG: decaprenyl-phosphate phosphoribosyltransferase [Roseiflexaceae bacterium]